MSNPFPSSSFFTFLVWDLHRLYKGPRGLGDLNGILGRLQKSVCRPPTRPKFRFPHYSRKEKEVSVCTFHEVEEAKYCPKPDCLKKKRRLIIHWRPSQEKERGGKRMPKNARRRNKLSSTWSKLNSLILLFFHAFFVLNIAASFYYQFSGKVSVYRVIFLCIVLLFIDLWREKVRAGELRFFSFYSPAFGVFLRECVGCL